MPLRLEGAVNPELDVAKCNELRTLKVVDLTFL